MCTDCWTKVESFHSFYMNVKSIETKLLHIQSLKSNTNRNDDDDEVKSEQFSLHIDLEETKFIPDDKIKNELDYDTSSSMHHDDDDNDEHNSDQSWTNIEESKSTKRCSLKRKVKLKKKPNRSKQKVPKKVKKPKSMKKKKDDIENAENDDDDDDKEKIESQEQYEKDDERIREFFHLKCDKCGDNQLYQSLREIRTHFRSKHSTARGYVMCCKRKFFRRSVLLEHLSWHLNPELFQ